MRSSGNGDPLVCAKNLMSMVIGEVPYDRLRGRDLSMLDRPLGESQATQNAKMVLQLYEPRLEPNVVKSGYSGVSGDFVVDVQMIEKRGGE